MTSERTVARLSLYRRILSEVLHDKTEHLHSHQLALKAGVTAAQVRRDLMVTGYDGSPKHGYEVRKLLHSLEAFLDHPAGQRFALIGVGNLGRALLSYSFERRPNLSFAVAFDEDPAKAGRVIHGCRCYGVDELEEVLRREDIELAVIAVPANQAQPITDRLARCGITGVLNFAPVALHAPAGVYVENLDVTTSLEKVAFFARSETKKRKRKNDGTRH